MRVELPDDSGLVQLQGRAKARDKCVDRAELRVSSVENIYASVPLVQSKGPGSYPDGESPPQERSLPDAPFL